MMNSLVLKVALSLFVLSPIVSSLPASNRPQNYQEGGSVSTVKLEGVTYVNKVTSRLNPSSSLTLSQCLVYRALLVSV